MVTGRSLRGHRVVSPVRTQVAENLRQAILSRQFQPGQRLVERGLVEATRASRASVREALRELAAEGLVTSIPNKGTAVTEVTRDEARQLYELRSGLEALAGRLFVERATAAEVSELERAFGVIEEAYARRGAAPPRQRNQGRLPRGVRPGLPLSHQAGRPGEHRRAAAGRARRLLAP